MSDELKPCPFCGEFAKHARYQDYDAGLRYHGWQLSDCFCPDGCAMMTRHTEAEAIAAWNRRAVTPLERELVAIVRVLACSNPDEILLEADALGNPIEMRLVDRLACDARSIITRMGDA